MADIVSLDEFASFLHVDVSTVMNAQNRMLLDLVQGQIVDVIGAQVVWSSTARSVALSAAARAYSNPAGLRSETVGGVTSVFGDSGVYLTADERSRLASSVGTAGPAGDFPEPVFGWYAPVAWWLRS